MNESSTSKLSPESASALDTLLRNDAAMATVYRAVAITARVADRAITVRDIVTDVVGDLVMGEVLWDPTTPIAATVIREARRRVSRAARTDRAFVSLSVVTDADLLAARELAGTAAPTDLERAARAERLASILPALRARAREDADVAQLLALFEVGVVKKADVMNAGLPGGRYHNARRRLRSLARALLAEPEQRVVFHVEQPTRFSAGRKDALRAPRSAVRGIVAGVTRKRAGE